MDAYAPIRKVPLDYNGIQSSAFSVQMEKQKEGELPKWNEVGVVGNKYLLIPNNEVKQLANNIASQSNLHWEPLNTFFDGRRYFHGMICKSETSKVAEGDDVALGMGFWNSYDGSTALSFRLFLVRLVCTNGMMTKDFFSSYRFKHDNTSEDYQEEIAGAANIINNSEQQVEVLMKKFRKMNEMEFSLDDLSMVRKNIPAIPVTTWGKIVDQYLRKHNSGDAYDCSYWTFYNACTDILWHDKKPTVASFNHNAYITDQLLGAIA
jgi:hypothetical protein